MGLKGCLKYASLYTIRILSILVVVSIIGYFLVLCSPNDPIESYVGKGVTNEERMVIEKNWGLNKPPAERYIIWIKNMLHGDFGQSIVYARPVNDILKSRAMSTLMLLGAAWLISGVLGFLFGVLAGVYQNSVIDRIIKTISLLFASVPAFWVGLLAVMLFAVKLKILPLGFSSTVGISSEQATIGDQLLHMILPSVTLGLVGVPKITMHTREKMIDVMKSDYMIFAFTRGESKWTAVRRHGIRNILLPALTLQFNSINELFSGSVLAEQVFSYPGLGNAATMAGLNGDANLLLGVTVISAVIVIAGNAIANVLYGVLDPLVREEYKKSRL